jgi:hypothetical protein
MNKQEAIIVDLDGTLANCDHRRHFVDGTHEKQDWRSFYESMRTDTINVWCRKIMSNFFNILVSGRPEEYRGHTLDWLEQNSVYVPSKHLFMRKTGDYRDDTIIKEEIYKEHIEPYYDILFVIDDRKKVVDAWRRLGLVALHCADGDF